MKRPMFILALVIATSFSAPAMAGPCDGIGDKPGIYVLSGPQKNVPLNGDRTIPYREAVTVAVVPDVPDEGLETTWNLRVFTKLRNERVKLNSFVKVRRNEIDSTCKQGGVKTGTDDQAFFGQDGAVAAIPDYDGILDKAERKKHAKESLVRWHFHWQHDRKGQDADCRQTMDHVKPIRESGQAIVANIDSGRRRTADAAEGKKKVRTGYNLVASVLTHRRVRETWCHTFKLNLSPKDSNGSGEILKPETTKFELDPLDGGSRKTYMVTWSD